MQQSSSSIGNLAAALAKAQVELVNPEKSMVATIPVDGKGGGQGDLSLRTAVQRARHCTQDLGPT